MKKCIFGSILLILNLAMTYSFAQNTRFINENASTQSFTALNENNGFERLHALLGRDYAQFMLYFEDLAVPAKLKDGGIFIEGLRENAVLEHSSATVMYPDGRIYAAYYDAENGDIRYFSNDPTTGVHPAILIWSRRFKPRLEGNDQSFQIQRQIKSATDFAQDDSSPDFNERLGLRQIAYAIYDPGIAAGWDMNAQVGDLLSQATSEIAKCSEAFDLVPRPVGFVPGWSYLAKTATPWFNYIFAVGNNSTYKACVVTAANNYRTAIELASIGI